MAYQPLDDPEYTGYKDPYDDPKYIAYLEEMDRHARCQLAACSLGEPDCPISMEIECYKCNNFNGIPVMRKVVALGPVVDRADPTQTYKLECGHLGI